MLARLRKHAIALFVAGEPVVKHQEAPLPGVTKAHGIDSLLTKRGGHEEAFDEFRVIGQHRYGRQKPRNIYIKTNQNLGIYISKPIKTNQKPAIPKAALLDVAAGGSGLRKYIPHGIAAS
jgi:hypothetical protein